MSDNARFDDYARTYTSTVQDAIGASGESVQFFADLKARLMARALGAGRPSTILDFGCGIGNTTRAIAAVFPDSAVTGVDVSEESVAVARGMTSEGRGRVRYMQSGEEALPFEDDSFDAAFTSCVFHHIEPRDRLGAAKEIRRVLAPGGSLFVFEHNPFNPLTRKVVANIPFDEGVSLLRPSETIGLLRGSGFDASPPWFYFFFPAFLRTLRPLETMMRRIPLGAQYFVVGHRPPAPTRHD